MNQLLEKIKIWILDTYDKVADFCREKWEMQRTLCIAFLALILLVIILLILIPANSASSKKALSEEEQFQEVEMEPFLSIPPEPFIEDDYVYTRKNITRWSDETVEEWFSEPDDAMLDDLKKANDKLVDDMMEVVP